MISSTTKICRLDTKPFIGLAFMVKPLDIYSEEIATSKYGESLERVNIKARVFDVVLGPQASDLKFHLATIDDKIYDVDAAKVFNCLLQKGSSVLGIPKTEIISSKGSPLLLAVSKTTTL